MEFSYLARLFQESVPEAIRVLIPERCPSGRRSTLGKRVCPTRVSWVRIPLSPQERVGQKLFIQQLFNRQ